MVALSLRGLVSRKLRTVLTAMAIVLGVGLVSGTYILTDTMNKSFDSVFESVNRNTDVSITPKEQFDDAGATPFSADVLRQVEAVPGVAVAAGSVDSDGAVLYKKNGRDPLAAAGGGGTVLTSESPRELDPLRYVEGHPPAGPDEIVLDKGSADKGDFKLGDEVRLSADGPQESFRLVGIAKLGDQDSIAGASLAVVQLETAQRLLDMRGEFSSISVKAESGVTPEELSRRIRAELPADRYNVRTGEQESRRQAADLQDQLGFLRTFLLAFAGISLFVGAFLIVNTYSITVAQRMREFALLRMIGASRRQVLKAVMGEALVVGFASAVVGFLFGFGLAPALRALFKAFGADLPADGLVLEPRTIVVSLLIGTIVTLVAATGPALRATRVPPIAALQDAASLTRGKTGRLRTPLSIGVTVIGLILILLGLFGGGSATRAAASIGAGAAVVFIGVGLLASHIVRPLALLVGLPLEKTRGVSGRLARENATRQPRRTASTSAALMIGVALVAFVAIFAAGLKASIDQAVDRGVAASLVMQTDNFQPVPNSASRALGEVQGVDQVSPLRFASAKVDGISGTTAVSGVDPSNVNDVFDVKWKEGSAEQLSSLGHGSTVVAKKFADKHDLRVGRRLTVQTPTGQRVEVVVEGIYDDDSALLADITLPNDVLASDFNVTRDSFVLATTTGGENADAIQKVADRELSAAYPTIEVLTKEGFKDNQAGQVDQLIAFVYVMLSLSVIVSLFGIVNTLVLAIHERTRELGMLRAIGTSRRQVRQIVRYESVITALIGAVLGVVLGAIFAVLVTIPLKDEGFAISIPIGTLIILLILAVIAGVIAAIPPARRAAKLDVLRALAYE
ncbi:ABC transporter permease [Conexibacter woesei]|uniref:ABC3 transporter permease protein domain-containing protein n=1 Tax=Conexibacter woesei (strain DSM 14684 / CCUG 47730 / CIP 108061 / JCM 11494 / NBRC 100937 / ID131577) TaxID=469383 RepID=D3F1G9_CONWI|nr:FtsX-like permease family protein [Conexibacter woesei]ADB52132.1 protein of unknown function DUF214 [Conexibacter woesei DSM 14684]